MLEGRPEDRVSPEQDFRVTWRLGSQRRPDLLPTHCPGDRQVSRLCLKYHLKGAGSLTPEEENGCLKRSLKRKATV